MWGERGGGAETVFFFRRITSPSASAEGCSVLGVNLELVNENHVRAILLICGSISKCHSIFRKKITLKMI